MAVALVVVDGKCPATATATATTTSTITTFLRSDSLLNSHAQAHVTKI
ncbi:MAG TPA: hypothetical protein VF518_08840 [Polyangia bacterium]